jgi:bifunctional DNase/RNase
MVEVRLADTLVEWNTGFAAAMLREVDGPRAIAIYMNWFEVHHLAGVHLRLPQPRPAPSALVTEILARLNTELEHVLISELAAVPAAGVTQPTVFFSQLVLREGARVIEIDARPSDALPVAVHQSRPLFANEAVLAACNLVLPPELEELLGSGIQQIERMSQQAAPQPGDPQEEEAAHIAHSQERAVRKLLAFIYPEFLSPQAPGPTLRFPWWKRDRRSNRSGLPIPHDQK